MNGQHTTKEDTSAHAENVRTEIRCLLTEGQGRKAIKTARRLLRLEFADDPATAFREIVLPLFTEDLRDEAAGHEAFAAFLRALADGKLTRAEEHVGEIERHNTDLAQKARSLIPDVRALLDEADRMGDTDGRQGS